MAAFNVDGDSLHFKSLTGAVVVLTGGSSGIGAATVRQLYSYGAKVIFGDLAATRTAAEALIASTSAESVHFLPTDVRNYEDNLALFKFALKQYGRVDHAIANAGLQEQPGWFDPRSGIYGVEIPPTLITIEVNLTGVIYFANIACSYLVHDTVASTESRPRSRNKSLTLLSSIAGWKESPGLFVYGASKHGVLGLMRSLRLYVPVAFPGVRVNAVCPSMTTTRMVDGIKDGWIQAGLPTNSPDDIAKAITAVCAAGPGTCGIIAKQTAAGGNDWTDSKSRGLNGRAIHVMGGRAYDIEQGLDDTQQQWLGETHEAVEAGQRELGDGTHWVKK